ncbi:MAG: Ig-like domain-containing protein, partial [Flavobacteriales bacterium]
DVDGDPLQVVDFYNGPLHGFVNGFVDGDTCFTYTPSTDYNGADAVDIIVCDGNGGCDTVTVVITVTPINDAPVIDDGFGDPMDTLSVTLPENTPINLCIPATDADGDALDITGYTNGPSSGSIFNILDGNTCFTYAPDVDYAGPDTVHMVMSDGNGGTDTLVLIIAVIPINDPPVITDGNNVPIDTLSTATVEDTPITICLNALDANGDTLDVSGFLNGPSNGTISGIADGDTCFTYTPNADWYGSDTMDVVVCDGNGGCDTLAVVIEVTPANDPPIADGDTVTFTMPDDSQLLVCIGATDPDGDPVDVTAVIDGPFNGIVFGLLDGDTCFTYMPASDWSGIDTMTVVICDPLNGCDTVVVIVHVVAVNGPPLIIDGFGVPLDSLNAGTDEDLPITLCLNAIDPDGDTLDVVSVANGPMNGQVTGLLNGDTCFTYTPNADWNGQDTMSVVVCDGNGGCDTVVVIITVVPVNDPPIAVDDTAGTLLNTNVVIDVQENDSDIDGDPLTIFSATASNGSVTINGDGTVTYLPNSGWCGTDTIAYIVVDGNSGADTAIVVVDVDCANNPPIAVNDNASTLPGDSITIDVLINDSDPDGDVIGVIGASALHGSVALNGDTSITYTPDSGFCGVDTIAYTIADGNGGTDDALVFVDVPCPNEPPIAVDDTATVEMDALAIIDVTDNDSDPNGDPLTVTDASANNGTVVINGDGSITYAPATGFCGNDTIVYTVCDPEPLCDTAIVVVEVACPDALMIPGGFSPNGDGIADTWVIQGLESYPEASVLIFNRWGNEVFSADPYANDWNGASAHGLAAGDLLPAGTYWYMLDLGVEGEEVRSGYIYLNR